MQKNTIFYLLKDQSNGSNKYLRNKIRNIILPSFQALNRNYKEGWANSISNIQEANEYISIQLKHIIEKYTLDSYLFIKKIDLSKIESHELFLLKQFLINKGLNKTQIKDFVNQ